MAAATSPAAAQATEQTTLPDPAPRKLRLPPEEVTALLARCGSFWAIKDISSARLLYERAADAGDGRAALNIDPVRTISMTSKRSRISSIILFLVTFIDAVSQ